MTINQFTALALALCGFMIGLRQIMLSPQNVTFPCAPLSVRIAMFLAAAAVGGLATLFLGHPTPYAGAAAVPVASFVAIMAFYNSIMAWNVVTQRLNPGIWRRIERAQAVARRKDKNGERPKATRLAHLHRG